MEFNRVLRNIEAVGDLSIGGAFGQQPEHFGFAGSEFFGNAGGVRRTAWFDVHYEQTIGGSECTFLLQRLRYLHRLHNETYIGRSNVTSFAELFSDAS